MGDHTDYNDGLVLPLPIPQQTRVRLAPRPDRQVVLHSESEAVGGEYELGREQRSGSWFDYVQGVTAALARRGFMLGGFEASISSSVPQGAGLSSSAALEVATLRALRTSFGLTLDDLSIARIGQEAEVQFVGAPTGLMDQLASSLGMQGHALWIDIRSLAMRTVPLPSEVELVVIASGVTHAHGDAGGYRVRRAECEQACERLGVSSLREVSLSQLARAPHLEPLLRRRARHVVAENLRVTDTAEALERSDLGALGTLFAQSHASLRDDFEVSVPEVDLLVQLGAAHPSIIAARLTGGGFGGSVVMLARRGAGLLAAREIGTRYAQQSGRQASVLLPG